MRFAARKEMDYLSASRGRNTEDAGLIQELGRRLEALRRYDQYFCHADWRPRRGSNGRSRPKDAES